MHGFAVQAELVANGDAQLLTHFASLARNDCGVVDIDFSMRGANAWVVGLGADATWWECSVELDRDDNGRWVAGASSASTWDGPSLAVGQDTDLANDALSLVRCVVCGSGRGSPPVRSSTSVRGIAASAVAAIELSVGGSVRRRSIDSPTGAFIVAVPVFDHDRSRRVHAIRTDGSRIKIV